MATTDHEPKKYPRMDLEDKDIDLAAIIKFTVVLLVSTVLVYVSMLALFEGYTWWDERNSLPPNALYKEKYEKRSDRKPEEFLKQIPKPILQTNATQGEDLKEFRAKEAKILKEGEEAINKIPVETAIDKLLQKGVVVRPEAEAQNFKDKAQLMPSDQSAGREFERRLR